MGRGGENGVSFLGSLHLCERHVGLVYGINKDIISLSNSESTICWTEFAFVWDTGLQDGTLRSRELRKRGLFSVSLVI